MNLFLIRHEIRRNIVILIHLTLLTSYTYSGEKEEIKLNKVKETVKNIVWTKTNGKQKPQTTLLQHSGNCLDQSRLVKYLLEKEGLKAKIVIKPTIKPTVKHATVKVQVGIKNYQFDNGTVKQVW